MPNAPYLIRTTGPGQADVVDRATGERVGRVWRVDWLREWCCMVGSAAMAYPTRAGAALAAWLARRS